MVDRLVCDENDAGVIRRDVDMGDGTFAELFIAHPPAVLITGTTRPRLRVDVAETSFFEGREFRTFKEWATATTSTYVVKVVVPIDLILQEMNVVCEEGIGRVKTMIGGTSGGTFSEVLPIFPANTMNERPQPAYINQVVLSAGGTHDGAGTVLDVLRSKTSGNSNFSSSVSSGSSMRGVGPGTYYFIFELSSFVGLFKARWEERP